MVSSVKPGRTGLSLLELLVAIALASVVGSAMAVTISRQQLFYRGASELHYAREGVRDAMEVMSTDIRGLSVFDTVRVRADSAIEFFAGIGSSVVCQRVGNEIGLPPSHSTGNSLSAFLATPDTGDIATFYSRPATGADQWEKHRIAGFASRSLASTCPVASGFSTQSDVEGTTAGFGLTLDGPLSGDVRMGAPVRFLRRARYSLYKAGDGLWYLGYRRCNASGDAACGAIQPLSGPYRPYNSDPRLSGLTFTYLDASGQRLGASDSPLLLARIEITARSESHQGILAAGSIGTISDSATISVAVRNRAR
jgi:type II secretory pathway pseudopilin PulG